MIAALTDLSEMLRALDVELRDEPYVFATAGEYARARAAAMITEREGLTVVLTEDVARELGLDSGPRFAWLTVTIHSCLEAVGLTAAISAALAAEGISCNILAGFHHDHLLVAFADRERAVATVRGLRSE